MITAGVPLTDGIKKSGLFCSVEGRFALTRKARVVFLTASERQALADELRAQIRACRENGIPLTHADSHHHVHEEWGIAAVVIAVCREHGIPYLRLARNCGPRHSFVGELYRRCLNLQLRKAKLARTRYFGSLADFMHLLEREATSETSISAEITVHPTLRSDGMLVDKTTGRVFEKVRRAALRARRDFSVTTTAARYIDAYRALLSSRRLFR